MTGRLLLAITLTAGCGAPEAAPAVAVFEGPEGEPVLVDSLPVERIVSTLQSATEWLIALDATDRLVARTDFDRQPELAHLPSLGGGLEISPEAVAALQPDLVIGWRIRASVDLARALGPLGIPVISLEATDTAAAFHQLESLGLLVGEPARADSLAAAIHSELDLLRSACREPDQRETVMVILWSDPPMTAGGGTWMSQLLDAACLRNVFGDVDTPWPTVSMEAIAARQPRWLLTSRGDSAGARLAELRADRGWGRLEAVREGRIIELDPDLLSRSGPAMAEWVKAVRSGRKTGNGKPETGPR